MKNQIFSTFALLSISCAIFACSNNEYDYEHSNLALKSPIQSPHRPYETCEHFNKNKYKSYPILKGTTSPAAFEAFGKKLAKDFVGIDTPTSSDADEISYTKEKKHLILNKKTYQITFLDDSNVAVQEGFKKSQILDTVRNFIKKYPQFSKVKDYYLVEQGGGDTNGASINGGPPIITISSYSVTIRKEFYDLAVLGGVSAAKFDIYAPGKISHFKIKFISSEQTGQTISSKKLLLPGKAKTKAKALYKKQFGEEIPSSINCRLGYLPNSFKSVPDTIAPGYIFEFSDDESSKTKIIFLPATTDPSILAKYDTLNQNGDMEEDEP